MKRLIAFLKKPITCLLMIIWPSIAWYECGSSKADQQKQAIVEQPEIAYMPAHTAEAQAIIFADREPAAAVASPTTKPLLM